MNRKSGVLKYLSLVLMLIALIILVTNPINRLSTKVAAIGLTIILIGSSLILFWKNRIVRYSIIAVVVGCGIILSFNGSEVDKDILQKEYVKALEKYEGVEYLWGGESSAGIDCSGLVRKGLMDTYFRIGFKNFSPQYIRKALYLWFYDCSAEALRDGYKEYTVPIAKNITLNTLEYSKLEEGDIMVTENGIHTMAYIGNKQWIQADPGKGKVIIEAAPSKENIWYDTNSRIVRWKTLNK